MNDAPAMAKKPRWRRWALEIAIFIAAFIAFQMWQLRDTVRGEAPAITGTLVDGRAFDLAQWRAEHPGKAVMLYFWADWCPICTRTAGNVSAVAKDWPVATMAVDSGDAAKVAGVMAERGYTWPTLVDASGEAWKKYGLPAVPLFMIIAPDGNIRFLSLGYTSEFGLRLRLWWASR